MASAPRFQVPPKEPEARKGRLRLLALEDMPKWFNVGNNEWVLEAYWPISGSVYAPFHSWCYLHNETVNIYSHLIPAVVFLLGEWYIL
jgi:adiponectin receptor